jgi:hypothetical protein
VLFRSLACLVFIDEKQCTAWLFALTKSFPSPLQEVQSYPRPKSSYDGSYQRRYRNDADSLLTPFMALLLLRDPFERLVPHLASRQIKASQQRDPHSFETHDLGDRRGQWALLA